MTVSVVGAVLAMSAVAVVSVGDPPAPAWLAFALASAVVLALAGLAPVAFELTRVSPASPAAARDSQQRLLVVADSHCNATAICDAVVADLAEAVAVHLVIPIRVSHLHFLADDEDDERREAERVKCLSVAMLKKRGVAVTGQVGGDKPLESMSDALGRFAATRVLLITPPAEKSYWLERDLLAKARRLTDVPVSQAMVPTAAARGSTANGRGGAVV